MRNLGRIGYLVHNINDPAVERRCVMLERGGATPVLAGFCRDAELREDVARRNPLVLGGSADAALLRRATATVTNTVFAGRLRRYFQKCGAVMARNLEQLAIARSVVGDRPLVYECLDIHRMLTGSCPAAGLIRAVEGALLPRVDLLITSSPAFLEHHFDHRPLAAPRLMVENKLLLPPGAVLNPDRPAPNPPWRIGWFGMLRCHRTLAFLTDLAKAGKGAIEVVIHGKPSPAEVPDLERVAAQTPHMSFGGPYAYDDLPRLYAGVHFAWTIDWFEEGRNSSWLLPNRIYEALANGAIPIALADIEVGRWLARHGAGLRVANAEDARTRLLTLEPSEVALMQQDVRAIDREAVVSGDEECRRLVDAIARAGAGGGVAR